MKNLSHGFISLFFITGVVSTASAAHAHHHGDIIGRILHKRHASSGSDANVTELEVKKKAVLPWFTAPATPSCDGRVCESSPSTPDELSSPTAKPVVQEVYIRTLQIDQTDPVATPTRRRAHTRPSDITGDWELEDKLSPELSEDGIESSFTVSFEDSADDHLHQTAEQALEEDFGSPLELRSEIVEPIIVKPRQDDSYQSFVLSGFTQPSSTAPASPVSSSPVCPAGNGTVYQSAANIAYQVICNVDFRGHDYPYQKVSSFEACLQKCDAFNYISHHVLCVAALYVPSRHDMDDDCYLKSTIENPTASSMEIIGAIRLSAENGSTISRATTTATSTPSSASLSSTSDESSASTDSASSRSSDIEIITSSTSEIESTTPSTSSEVGSTTTSSSAPSSTSAPSTGSEPEITFASGDSIITPKVAGTHLQGVSKNTPSKQYIEYDAPKAPELASSLLTVGVNGDLTTGYPISPQTGVLSVNASTQSKLGNIDGTPHLSRDGGQGGMINGHHIFVFCDTGSYTTTTSSSNGKFLGFVSSSVAVDVGMNGLKGEPLNLQDGIGEWSDDVGRQRGFAPLTEGEQAYNQAVQGKGQRYAIWPEAPIIPLDGTSGILYAPIVYDNVNRATKATKFTYTGETLLTITVDDISGPIAKRTVPKIFDQDEVGWGAGGGLRSWGASGVGGNDGSVYLFGNIQGGILLARTSAAKVADRNSFEYWDGKSWTSKMPSPSSQAFFITGRFMDVALFYSPRHLTFVMVYLNTYADNTFYYRYLKADRAILPPFAPGGDPSSDYVENMVKYDWSDEYVLYKAPKTLSGKYIYAGAVHEGYYGSNDITNGGSKMLLSWTAPTGEDPSSLNSEYQIVTAEVDWA